MVVFDATMLMLLIWPDSGRPIDPNTDQPVERVSERIAHFIELHEKSKTRIGIPTPALSEILVRAGVAAGRVLEKIKEFAVFEILPFDELSAIEVAMMTKIAIDSGDKRSGSTESWSKIKYARQILAIAKTRQATVLYTDDTNLRNLARAQGLHVIGISELDLPPEDPQHSLDFLPPASEDNEPSLDEIEKARETEFPE